MTKINVKQRERRARKRAAAQGQARQVSLTHPAPCCLGEGHRVHIALRHDGSLLSVRSDCTDNPPQPEEVAVVRALLSGRGGEDTDAADSAFFTCADFVRDIRLTAGATLKEGDELSEGYPRAARWAREAFDKDHRLTLFRAVQERIRRVKRRPEGEPRYDEAAWRGDHRSEVLQRLSTGPNGERWGEQYGLNLRVTVENIDVKGKRRMAVVILGRSSAHSQYHKVAVYRGSGVFAPYEAGISHLARNTHQAGSARDARGRQTCRLCGKGFKSLAGHVQTTAHRERVEGFIFDMLAVVGQRLRRRDWKLALAQPAQPVVE